MNLVGWRRLAVAPVFLWSVAIAAAATGTFTGWVALGFVVAALPLLAWLRRSWALPLSLPLLATIVTLAFAYGAQVSFSSGLYAELAAGLLIGSPLLFLAAVELLAPVFGLSYLALSEGLAQGVVLSAAAIALAGAHGAGAFVTAYGNVLAEQINGIATVLHGGTGPPLPLSTAGDAVFYGFAILAFLGCLLGSLALEGGTDWPAAPPGPALPRPSRRAPSMDLGLPPPVQAALAGRTESDGSPAPFRAALLPVALGVMAVVVFLGVAAAAPTYALAAMGLGAAIVLAIAIAFGRVRRTPPIQGGEPGEPLRV